MLWKFKLKSLKHKLRLVGVKRKAFKQFEKLKKLNCDAPNSGCPLTTRQPAEKLYISYHETHT